MGLEIPIAEVEETITHPIVRARLVYAIRGGAVPRLSTDEPTDVDTFLEPVEGQEPTETNGWFLAISAEGLLLEGKPIGHSREL